MRACYWSTSFVNSPAFLKSGISTYINGGNNIKLGNNISIGNNCFLDSENGKLVVGENSHFNQGVLMLSSHGEIILGANILVGPYCVFRAGNHKYDQALTIPISKQGHTPGKIIVGTNVWIGAHCTILPGTEIGNNCVIAAGAVVNSKVPSNTIAGGIPAKVIRSIDPDKVKKG